MRIALSTDHAGFGQVARLKRLLETLGHEYEYFGPANFQSGDDYPDFIYPAAHAVASGACERGIIYGGSGQGEAMVANRVAGVRCAVYYGPAAAVEPIDASGAKASDAYEILRLSRQHNDANILSLGARFLRWNEVEQAVKLWLATEFSDAERHTRRIKKVDNPE